MPKIKRVNKIFLLIPVLILIISIWFVIDSLNPSDECAIPKQCEDCIVGGCLVLNETNRPFLKFVVQNQHKLKGNCTADISITNEGLVISQFSYPLGYLAPDQKKKYTVNITVPGGESQFTVIPRCIW